MIALQITALLLVLLYGLNRYKFLLHMMQQNSYRNERFNKWAAQSKGLLNPMPDVATAISLMLLWFLNNEMVIYGFAIFASLYTSYTYLRKKHKKKLTWTARAKRIYGVSLVFWLVLSLGLSFTLMAVSKNPENQSLGSALKNVVVLAYYLAFSGARLMLAANTALQPVEKRINNWYIADAAKMLQSVHGIKVIGITGSFGKTSAKHFLHRILSEKYNVLMTPGSYNTTLGVVRTIREQLKPQHQVFIAEMGAKQQGDIKEICDIVKPHHAIITAIAEQHLDTFKTLENVRKTKLELADAIPAGGIVALNADYDTIYGSAKTWQGTSCFYSVDTEKGEYCAKNTEYSAHGMKFEVWHNDQKLMHLETRLMGSYNVSNIMAAVVIAIALDVPYSAIAVGVKRLEPVAHRLDVKRTAGGVTILDDAFNSNPAGARMALDVLGKMAGGSKVVVTPGMIELGDKQEMYNFEFGKQMAAVANYVVLVGPKQTAPIYNGLEEAGYNMDQVFVARNLTEATSHLNARLKTGDVVLYENDLPDTFNE